MKTTSDLHYEQVVGEFLLLQIDQTTWRLIKATGTIDLYISCDLINVWCNFFAALHRVFEFDFQKFKYFRSL